MECFLIKNTSISAPVQLHWLLQNAHRIIRLTGLKYMDSDKAKLVALLKDGSTFHASFLSYRSMVSWLFRPQFADRKLALFGFQGGDSNTDWQTLDSSPTEWITTGSSAHWDLLSKLMGS